MKKKAVPVLLAVVLCFTLLPTAAGAAARDTSAEDALAADLKQLGLFQGVSDTDFDLGRTPNRTEALVMLIRFLGKEAEALEGRWTHPFTDVPAWADSYVGYAYETGLANGLGGTLYGANMTAGSTTFLTFVLRALGYSDTNGADFAWDDPYKLASEIGILPQETNIVDFWRADMVRVSHAALPAKLKNSSKALYETLIESGVFTRAQYNAFYHPAAPREDAPAHQTALTAEQISAKCAPAVFYIDCYALNGTPFRSGSGFFLSADGLAVTNFHVAANCSRLVITTIDGKTYSDVRVLDSDGENDLALLKVAGSNFPYLELADSSRVVQGQKAYAIGSPLGLTNTMSEGIISNPRRTLHGTEYIQISVPIAPGSSGGALLNEEGKAIGVTSAIFQTGDLNLAIPSNRIGPLRQSADPDGDFILWQNTYYPDFEHIPDFGEFSQAELVSITYMPLGYYIEYDAYDFYDLLDDTGADLLALTLRIYQSALLKNGFVPDETADGLFGWYTTPTEAVYLDADPLGTGLITVVAVRVPQYYAEVPQLPDYGWFVGVESGAATPSKGSLLYVYKWIDIFDSSDDFEYSLSQYFELLTDDGFVPVHSDSTSALFEGNGLSVVYTLDGTLLWVDVAPL